MTNHAVTTLLVLASMSCTVAGNLILKTGAGRRTLDLIWPLNVVNVHVALAAITFGLAFLFYAMVLRRLPLSLAQAIMSVQFVLVILAARLVLNEGIGPLRWVGITLMAVGLLVVSASPNVQSAQPATTSNR